jgi:crotonobetainyl-CoA:carnitine CoA-transferase CaiB-like acyl-CoA transferase
MRALEGLLVLDLTRLLPGAVATQTLAAHGARVIKIEQPRVGDYARHEHRTVFAATNRGKESIELDLKNEDARNALRLLAMQADVLVEGFRPGVMHRLGLDYEHLRTLNPRLIYVALTGYGQQGECSQMAGHDINYLALSGVLAEIGTAETPVVPGVQLADLAGGSMQAVTGILLALQARERTGEGQFVDVSMTDGVAALLPVPLSSFAASGKLETRGDSLLTGRYACYAVYRAAQGFVAVGALEPKFWRALCEALGEPSWVDDQFADEPRRGELKRLLAARFLEKSAEEWFAELRDRDCCVTPVRDLVSARPCVAPQPRLSATPGEYAHAVPALGEHTRAVLEEFGYPLGSS